jgi:hypothetical protein
MRLNIGWSTAEGTALCAISGCTNVGLGPQRGRLHRGHYPQGNAEDSIKPRQWAPNSSVGASATVIENDPIWPKAARHQSDGTIT